MKLSFFANLRAPNSWYRALGPLATLNERGHTVRFAGTRDGHLALEPVLASDLFLLHRAFDAPALKIVTTAKAHGVAVVWDNDDDFTAVPRGNAAHRQLGGFAGHRVRQDLQRILAAVDVATAPSRALTERFSELGADRVHLLENYVRDEIAPCRTRRDDGRVVVGWLAGGEHHLDVERLPISEACLRLLDRHQNVEVVSLGARLRIRHERYRNERGIPFLRLPERMANFDIGIAPIADIPLNRSRSNIKVKEYAALGIPWLASGIGPYVGLGEAQGGRLVSDEAWYDELERLVVDHRRRTKLAKRALAWSRGQTIGANAELWEATFEAVIAVAGDQVQPPLASALSAQTRRSRPRLFGRART